MNNAHSKINQLIDGTIPVELQYNTDVIFAGRGTTVDKSVAGKIKVNNNVDGEINTDWNWPLDVVLRILRLGDNSTIDMSFNNQGLLQIKVDSGMGVYTYLLPARS